MLGAVTAARIWLGSMFLYAAGLRLAHIDRASRSVLPYRILPRRAAKAAGLSLPFVELLTGGLLLFGRLYPIGPLLATSLGGGFGYAAYTALRRGSDSPCGCAGSDLDRVTRTTLVRALAITLSGLGVSAGGRRLFTEWPAKAAVPMVIVSLLPGAEGARERIRYQRWASKRATVRNERIAELARLLAAPPPK